MSSLFTPKFLDDLCVNDFAIVDNFLNDVLIEKLFRHVLQLSLKSEMKPAQIGENAKKLRNSEIRGDLISWIVPQDEFAAPYLKQIEELRILLNSELFLSLKRFESHYALYPKGSFYLPHYDYHQLSQHRILTCILYVSPWKKDEGGELIIHHNEKIEIEPKQGRFVCFKSKSILHEVKTYLGDSRASVTGWLRDDETT